jgi:hypothetical protein
MRINGDDIVSLPATPAPAVFRPEGASGDRSGENLAADCDGILAKAGEIFFDDGGDAAAAANVKGGLRGRP